MGNQPFRNLNILLVMPLTGRNVAPIVLKLQIPSARLVFCEPQIHFCGSLVKLLHLGLELLFLLQTQNLRYVAAPHEIALA